MMNFYEINSAAQILILVFNQLTILFLTVGIVFLYKRKSKRWMQAVICLILLLNMTLYVIMQLDNHLVRANRNVQFQMPYIIPLLLMTLSLAFNIWVLLSETKNRKTLSHRSIKESFDNLPTGVCYFNGAGLPVLCNQAMYRFSFAVCGRDIQYITDLESLLADDFTSPTGAEKEGSVFISFDGNAWQLEKRFITREKGDVYTQYVAADVTDLHRNQEELMQENEQLRKVQEELKKLSANVVTVTREEEILNTKMRVHDKMGRCLIEAQKYLQEDREGSIPDSVAYSWRRAVAMVKYGNDIPNEDMLSQIRKACESMKLTLVQNGNLPQQEQVAYIFACAIRECVTNAVRYAGADALYATFTENENESMLAVTNSGIQPESEIVEGGGLSTLRRRVERAGGSMHIQSKPYYKLNVTIPKEKEGVL